MKAMPQENKISVVINTYNAEKHLREVLESVKSFDEIVICDMESKDNTLAIAKEYNCKIVTFPKANHLSAEPARTFAIQSASYKWVLVVDADELVTTELRTYLYNIIKQEACPKGLYIARRNRDMNVLDKGRLRDFQLRFFIRKGTIWPPYVHTFPQVQGRIGKLTDSNRAVLIHLDENYLHERIEKINRYSDGEIDKRISKQYGLGALLWRPIWRFFKAYIMDQQYKKGLPGFISSCLSGFYQFLIVAKSIEKRKYKKA
jgi:glycosyltransferase, group 2 family protein